MERLVSDPADAIVWKGMLPLSSRGETTPRVAAFGSGLLGVGVGAAVMLVAGVASEALATVDWLASEVDAPPLL